MKKFIEEFKQFITRGNVVDMSIGIVIGSAFTAIINSVVKDLINPIIGYILTGVNFSQLKLTLSENAVIGYGNILNAAINFIIICFILFLFLKLYNNLLKKTIAAKNKAEEEKPKQPTSEEILLEILNEIKRD